MFYFKKVVKTVSLKILLITSLYFSNFILQHLNSTFRNKQHIWGYPRIPLCGIFIRVEALFSQAMCNRKQCASSNVRWTRCIESFPSRFSLIVQHVAERSHVAKSLCHVSASHLAIIFPSMQMSLLFIHLCLIILNVWICFVTNC